MPEENKRRSVLLVDGNERITRFLKISLEHAGCYVSIAHNIEEVEAMADKLRPDIVALASPLAADRHNAASKLRDLLGCPVAIYGVGDYSPEEIRSLACDGFIDRFYEPEEFIKQMNAIAARGRKNTTN